MSTTYIKTDFIHLNKNDTYFLALFRKVAITNNNSMPSLIEVLEMAVKITEVFPYLTLDETLMGAVESFDLSNATHEQRNYNVIDYNPLCGLNGTARKDYFDNMYSNELNQTAKVLTLEFELYVIKTRNSIRNTHSFTHSLTY